MTYRWEYTTGAETGRHLSFILDAAFILDYELHTELIRRPHRRRDGTARLVFTLPVLPDPLKEACAIAYRVDNPGLRTNCLRVLGLIQEDMRALCADLQRHQREYEAELKREAVLIPPKPFEHYFGEGST